MTPGILQTTVFSYWLFVLLVLFLLCVFSVLMFP